jgi:hypothetical protein
MSRSLESTDTNGTAPASTSYTEHAEHVFDAEHACIAEQRRARGVDPKAPAAGLALSGGGLRAVAFGLGVSRAFAKSACFDRFDYVSSVGGGSLASGAIQWFGREQSSRREPGPENELMPRKARQHIADNVPGVTSGNVIRRGLDRPNDSKPYATLSVAPLAAFHAFRSVFVHGGLLVGVFFLVALASGIVEVLKPALLLVTRETAWYYVITNLNFGLAAALVALFVGIVGVLADPMRRVLRRMERALVPAVPAVGPATWKGALWLMATLVCLVFAITALFDLGSGPAAGFALALFAGLTFRSARAWRASWREPQSGSTSGLGAALGVAAALLGALLLSSVIFGAEAFYVLGSGRHAPGEPTRLNPWLGLIVAFVPLLWTALSLVHLARRARARRPSRARDVSARIAYERSLAIEHRLGNAHDWIWICGLIGLVELTERGLVLYVSSQLARILSLSLVVGCGVALIMTRTLGAESNPPGAARSRRSGIAFERLEMLRWRVLCLVVAFAVLLLANTVTWGILDSRSPRMILVVIAGALLLGSTSRLNFTGLTAVYRNRIIEAFLPNPTTVFDGRWSPASTGSELPLAEASNARGPYPLFNASLTTTGSSVLRRRTRTADAFVLSPLYSGSSATGWVKTEAWQRQPFTLADALTTSALGLVPGGRSGERNGDDRTLTAILALLGLRTGTWVPHPNPERRAKRPHATLLRAGIASDFSGRGLAESAPFLSLSDGRLFDELGLYELLRRQLDVIVVVDVSADPELEYGALALCLMRAWEDFGIDVTFDAHAADRALASGDEDGVPRARRRAAAAHALGRIRYPDREKPGSLLVLKPAFLTSMPASVEAHGAAYGAFPHERYSIGRLDEEYFYAYEELGFEVALRAEDALKRALRIDEGRDRDKADAELEAQTVAV